MKALFSLAFSLVALFTVNSATAPAQCSGGQCGSSWSFNKLYWSEHEARAFLDSQKTSAYHGWYQVGDNNVELWWRGERVGNLDPSLGQWRTHGKTHTVDLGELGLPAAVRKAIQAKPPQCVCEVGRCECRRCPNDCVAEKKPQLFQAGPFEGVRENRCDDDRCFPVLNYGCDWQRTDRERHAINGKEVGRREALRAVGGGDLPDDSKLLRVTVIGPAEQRSKVLADLDTAAELVPFSGKIVKAGYEPSHWHVAASGFKTDGKPTIYVQAPDGKVLHRQDDYQGGPARLAKALRKADPSYDPAKDPDLTKPKQPDAPKGPDDSAAQSPNWSILGLLAAALVAGLTLFHRKQQGA